MLMQSCVFTALEWLWYQTMNCKIALAMKQNCTVFSCDLMYYLSKEAYALKWMWKGCIVYNTLPICSVWQQDVSIHLVLTDWGGWLSSGLENGYGWTVKNIANVYMRCINLAQEVITSGFLPVWHELSHTESCQLMEHWRYRITHWNQHAMPCFSSLDETMTLYKSFYKENIINTNTQGGIWTAGYWVEIYKYKLKWHTVHYQSTVWVN